jgi:hypothetical protein
MQNGGGEERNDSLTILQTTLFFIYIFLHEIKIVQSYKYSHKSLVPLSRFLHI